MLHSSRRREGRLPATRRGCVTWTCFRRLDREGAQSDHNFALQDGGGMLVRRDPSKTQAIVISDQPLWPAGAGEGEPGGRYFQVRVRNLFTGPSSLARLAPELLVERPGCGAPPPRAAGLVLGVTAARPGEIRSSVRSAQEVQLSWCISADGWLQVNASPFPASLPAPPASQKQAHMQVLALSSRTSPGPLELAEDCTVGLLVRPCGELALFLDGSKKLAFPDAGVPAEGELRALIEVSGHVRSIQALPGARPPS